jgi:hypothetical protein
MLIKHRPSHLNKGPICGFNNTILLRHNRREKLMLKSQRSTKGLKMSILEFCAIVIASCSHGILREFILQPENQISSICKSLILRLHEERPRIARKVVNDHKHIPHLPNEQTRARPTLSIWSNSLSSKVITLVTREWEATTIFPWRQVWQIRSS